MPKPFLKWPGSKQRLAPLLRQVLPPGLRLIEPFVGSAAVFLASVRRYDAFLLADLNEDLITLFCLVRDEGEPFVRSCLELFGAEWNREDAYYALRNEFNRTTDARRRAQLLVYLNRHCFNGLCRYNQAGGFNVPFGRYRSPHVPFKEMMAFHRAAQGAEFRVADFRETMAEAGPGDVVYCDPPYVPLSRTASFTDYAKGGFGADEQRALVQEAHAATRRGAVVVLSNHDTPLVRAMYQGARMQALSVRRSISGQAGGRGHVPEVLAVFDGRRSVVREATNQLLLWV